MNLPKPVRPLYVWGGYFVIALLLSAATGGAEWVKVPMGLYLVWAIVESVRYFRARKSDAKSAGVSAPAVSASVGLQGDGGFPPDYAGVWNEDREVAESERTFETLWTGRKEISFGYRDRGSGKPYEVTAVAAKVICPEFGEDQNTYFQATPSGGASRYYCLGYLTKGRKVTDVATGEVGTLRQVLGVKRRVYK